MGQSAQQYLQKLLPFFHYSPMAMAEIDAQGTIRRANPKAIQLLMPLAARLNITGDNLLDVLMAYLPTLSLSITNFAPDAGLIVDQEPYRIGYGLGQAFDERHFCMTVQKMSPNTFLIFFEDLTDFLAKADALRQQP